jgi:2',3'-cyclic-nucleotide 2'-phosphodiesterase (5'-nucleotidase family)
MAESSFDAHYVVAVDVSINVNVRDGRRSVTWWPQFRVIDTADVAPDPEVAAVVRGFEQELSREFDVAIATTEVELDSRAATLRTREAAMGNLMADAIRFATGADVALMNGGGIRSGKVYAPGSSITRRDILAELPFGNRVVLLEIAGRDIRAALEHGLRNAPEAVGGFPQIAGMKVVADTGRPAGQRIVSAEVGGAPLDDGKSYKLATNDFLARGGDGYSMLREGKPLQRDFDAPLLANEVMVYLRRIGVVRSGVDGRLTMK